MDQSILIIAIISVLTIVVFFAVDSSAKEPAEKKTWHFVPIDCLEMGEVRFVDKLIIQDESCGCGVYSITPHSSQAVSRDLKPMLDKGEVTIDFSTCAERIRK